MEGCYCCNYKNNPDRILFENAFAACIAVTNPVLVDSCVIIPIAHKESPFDFSPEEWLAAKELLDRAKAYLEGKCHPDGYNLGWNVGRVAGQTELHAHLHVIPRFSDEPLAGKGIRYWFKQAENLRPSQSET